MILLDGKKLRDEILEEVRQAVDQLGCKPVLVVVQVGEDPASTVYIRNKVRACEATGIESRHDHLPEDISQADLEDRIRELNASDCDGILLQLPLPEHLDENRAMDLLDPNKDVDGFHPVNLGRLLSDREGCLPCTPAGIREMLVRQGIETAGKEVVIVGRSLIVGKPMALLFLAKGSFGDASVTVCHSRSKNLAKICSRADILVAAVGRPGLITGDMVKQGAVVIDVGINRVEDDTRRSGYRLAGDCDFESVAPVASAITPVPGGVGPMTIAMLMRNTLQACRRKLSGERA